MESVLVCTEGEGASGAGTHQHRDTCYKETLICGTEEHQHTLLCYSNPEADLETADIWERTLPAALSGNWADDLIAVAESQLGYHESTNNYILDEGGYIHGYTRYGVWYGSPYGDWCAMFASFCLHYAGIPESAFPDEAGLHPLGRASDAGRTLHDRRAGARRSGLLRQECGRSGRPRRHRDRRIGRRFPDHRGQSRQGRRLADAQLCGRRSPRRRPASETLRRSRKRRRIPKSSRSAASKSTRTTRAASTKAAL